jgi:hypothetical protein
MAAIRDAAFEGGWRMSDLLKKLNEMEARHAREFKEIREAIEKEVAAKGEIILGGMFRITPAEDDWGLADEYLMKGQIDRLRAIEKILQTAYNRSIGSVELYDAFTQAEKLGLKF